MAEKDMLDDLQTKEIRRQKLADKIWDSIVSKKLLVWCFASYLFLRGSITKEEWEVITGIFLGAEGAIKTATVLSGGRIK